MSREWSGGSTRQWRRKRAQVLAGGPHPCALALDGTRACPRHPGSPLGACRGCTGPATTAHHTRGRAATGDDPGHLVPACSWCNGHVGDPATWPTSHRPVTRW